MRIEEGKQYVTRSGEVVGPMEPTRFGEWRGWDGGRLLFEMDGRHGDESDTENHFVPNEPENDIVAVVVPAPGSSGQNGALDWADDLIEHNRKRLLMEAAAPQMLEALRQAIGCDLDPNTNHLARAAIAAATGVGK